MDEICNAQWCQNKNVHGDMPMCVWYWIDNTHHVSMRMSKKLHCDGASVVFRFQHALCIATSLCVSCWLRQHGSYAIYPSHRRTKKGHLKRIPKEWILIELIASQKRHGNSQALFSFFRPLLVKCFLVRLSRGFLHLHNFLGCLTCDRLATPRNATFGKLKK